MIHVTIFILAVYTVTATPLRDNEATIINYENVNDGNGNYNFGFATSNGIIQRQIGELKQIGNKTAPVTVSRGFFFFTTPDNATHEVRFVADENGYRSEVLSTHSNLSNYEKQGFDAHDKVQNESTLNQPAALGFAQRRVEMNETVIEMQQPKVAFETPLEKGEAVDEVNMNNTTGLKFPDRIGTPAIISLQGPPGK